MDPPARTWTATLRRACVAFRVKLSRDTGVNLTADNCEELLWATFCPDQGSSTSVGLQSDPGRFYASLGWRSPSKCSTKGSTDTVTKGSRTT